MHQMLSSCKLRLFGAAVASGCFVLLLTSRSAPVTVEVSASNTQETTLTWFPSGAGHLFFYLSYDVESLPLDVNQKFLNWKAPPQPIWEASLVISTNGVSAISLTSLQLQPAIQSRKRLYFRIADYKCGTPCLLGIRLIPNKGQPPFGGATPSLSVRANELAQESYPLTVRLQRLAKLGCLFAVAGLLADYARLAARVGRETKGAVIS